MKITRRAATAGLLALAAPLPATAATPNDAPLIVSAAKMAVETAPIRLALRNLYGESAEMPNGGVIALVGGKKRMADLGVRALRFHHMPHGIGFSSLGMQSFEKLAPIMAELGLHAQFMMDANALDSALPFFKHWTLPVVIDHMGNVDGTLGADQPGVQQMCRLLGEGKIWVKVSGSYRVSTQHPDYPDSKPIHEALVRANPDQIIWGTDWPHPRMEKDMPEDGHLLDLFNAWTPDAGLRKRILVDNPERLYGFS